MILRLMVVLSGVAQAQEAVSPVIHITPGREEGGARTSVQERVNTETLGTPSHFVFAGSDSALVIPDGEAVNAPVFSLAAWVNPAVGSLADQKPVLVKSLEGKGKPWYQYGLFLIDRPDFPGTVAFNVSKNGTLHQLHARGLSLYGGWTHIVATHDGTTLRLYINGKPAAEKILPPGPLTVSPTPLLIGAYQHHPRTPVYCFRGGIADLRVYGRCLSDGMVGALHQESADRFPAPMSAERIKPETAYEKALNAALRSPRDVWGEELIRAGGATYDRLKDLLQPLYLSTGETNTDYAPHTVLFGDDGGRPPYIVATADGHRLYANHTRSGKRIDIEVEEDGRWQAFAGGTPGSGFPKLEKGFYPILLTRHTTARGVDLRQTTCVARSPELRQMVGVTRISVSDDSVPGPQRVRFRLLNIDQTCVQVSPPGTFADDALTVSVQPGRPCILVWSPSGPMPERIEAGPELCARGIRGVKAYWDDRLKSFPFEVPEPLVMDALRNLTTQNLVMRWRYSLGSAVYHNSFYQPESSDACCLLGKLGYPERAREGLQSLIGMTKGKGQYTNWEFGEKLSHAAEYYHLTGDAEFIRTNAAAHLGMVQRLAEQVAGDPRGLLEPQRMCGDQSYRSYAVFHLTVCWRGMRDLRHIWQELGMEETVAACGSADVRLRRALDVAIRENTTVLPDGSVFIPNRLYEKIPVFSPITATRDGSYWNLCMPYAFSSGFWRPDSDTMDGVAKFLHEHGGTLLGMVRFNYYPVPIGGCRPGGLPGYSTTGVDNVYLPGYVRFLSDRDEAERLVLSFYGMLAHGMTRGTFIAGEGDTLGAHPDYPYRSSYGSYCSGNNTGKLLAFRQMLVRESFDHDTGLPQGLFLAHATPPAWLEHGHSVRVREAPTAFGPVSCEITSRIGDGHVDVYLKPPVRRRPECLRIRLRLPPPFRLADVADLSSGAVLLSDRETIELGRRESEVRLRLNVERVP
ncbi:MAG: LamG domain-containing protein [Lentisphaerae bacterium]|jgi:hypothetical protein|nr:LamG domain-containing protein [Lentisphaerota bacterium]MBT5606399.1 LamG domain-containing protein [Lentisphaerota bacterium]MBT7059749.1 LamG domain-containing protein [Lentisphaerota bacterium]MBT7847869.1 LamG domain-containing protein [Lentisphaerota bacterium]